MELRVLRYFLAIAREENMTKAASVLHLTQPTLSRQIHQLEQELGTTLFIRNGHHIFLTASGMRLKQRAQDLVELADRTEAEMKQKEEIIIIVSVSVLCVAVPTGLHTVSRNSVPRNVKR